MAEKVLNLLVYGKAGLLQFSLDRGGGRVLPIMAYTGRGVFTRKEYLFQASGI